MPRLAAFPKGFFDAILAGRMSVFDARGSRLRNFPRTAE
jgi:hypothetical protein